MSDIPPLTQEELVNLISITEQLSGMDSLVHMLHQQASMDPSSLMKHGRTKGIKSKLATLTFLCNFLSRFIFVQPTTNSGLKFWSEIRLLAKSCY